ncbi:MAG TPA: DinB family protein [Acidimicrobiales bacterium]|nr:DinB family protein [Acidimicrobiales bacterium]
MADKNAESSERADLLAALEKQRHFLRFPLRDLTDEQANERTTASALTLGGIVKHVTAVEQAWANFIVEGPSAMSWGSGDTGDWESGFRMSEGETVKGLLDAYDDVARRTDDLVATLPDLDAAHPLPDAPWFEKGATWSARRVVLHIIGETAQHAGHADIIRESLDGAKSMG